MGMGPGFLDSEKWVSSTLSALQGSGSGPGMKQESALDHAPDPCCRPRHLCDLALVEETTRELGERHLAGQKENVCLGRQGMAFTCS